MHYIAIALCFVLVAPSALELHPVGLVCFGFNLGLLFCSALDDAVDTAPPPA